MCRLPKQKSNKANSLNSYPPAKGYFRETYKSQNINPISPTSKFTLGIIQIIVKSILTIFSMLSSKKINLSVQYQYLTRGVCKVKVVAS